VEVAEVLTTEVVFTLALLVQEQMLSLLHLKHVLHIL
jgi:hypothetical protein